MSRSIARTLCLLGVLGALALWAWLATPIRSAAATPSPTPSAHSASSLPSPTATLPSVSTGPTATATVLAASGSATAAPTSTPTPTPSDQPGVSQSGTPSPTVTPVASASASSTVAPPATATKPAPTKTPTLVPSPTASKTPPPTVTPTLTPTPTWTPTNTPVPPAIATRPPSLGAQETDVCLAGPCGRESAASPESETPRGADGTSQAQVRPILARNLDASNETSFTLWTIPDATLSVLRSRGESGMLWQVPFRSQLDGSFYQHANCGPASLAMVLESFGVSLPTGILRQTANRLQGSYGYLDGIGIDYLVNMAEDAGLEPEHLYDGSWYRRWYPELVRWHVRQGHPVLTLVKYRSLPGNDDSQSTSDHYVVITGLIGDSFVYNDPAFLGTGGYARIISEQGLTFAWDRSDVPRLAVAFRQGTAPKSVALVQDWKSVAPAVGRGPALPAAGEDPEDVPLHPFTRITPARPASPAGALPAQPAATVVVWEQPRGDYYAAPPARPTATPASAVDAAAPTDAPTVVQVAPASATVAPRPLQAESAATLGIFVNPLIVLLSLGLLGGLIRFASWRASDPRARRSQQRASQVPEYLRYHRRRSS